jgi:hypothetical protein
MSTGICLLEFDLSPASAITWPRDKIPTLNSPRPSSGLKIEALLALLPDLRCIDGGNSDFRGLFCSFLTTLALRVRDHGSRILPNMP